MTLKEFFQSLPSNYRVLFSEVVGNIELGKEAEENLKRIDQQIKDVGEALKEKMATEKSLQAETEKIELLLEKMGEVDSADILIQILRNVLMEKKDGLRNDIRNLKVEGLKAKLEGLKTSRFRLTSWPNLIKEVMEILDDRQEA